ncbi:hypothetical protein MRX96_055076 [Rhipicephalus microplus]
MNPHQGPDPDPSTSWEPGDYIAWGQGPEAGEACVSDTSEHRSLSPLSRIRPRTRSGPRRTSSGRMPEATTKHQGEQKTPDKIETSPPSTAIAAVFAPATKTTGEGENEEVEMVAVETQQRGAKRKIPLTKTKEQNDTEKDVKRPCPSTKRTDVLEDMINKLSDKMEKMFNVLVGRLSDSEAESKALALKHDKWLEELEKKLS